MSERSGLGPVELAVLAASDTTAGGFRRCSDVLADVLADIALGPAYAYPLLCDLARPWKLLDPLIEASGNFGSQGNDPAASPQYTECRPSELGVLTLAVEARAVPALPMWLVIGDLHAGGVRPPLPLGAVVTALERLLADPTAALDDLFWPVVLPGGAAVDGDREAFLAGEPTTLRLDAKIIIEQTPRGPRRLLVSVPYDVNVDELVQRLADQGRMWRDRDRFPRVGARAFAPVLDVQDESTLRTGLRIAVRLDEDAPDAEGLLQAVWGVHRMVDVRVPGGPGGALRAWFAAHAEAGLPAAVALLRDVAEGRGAGRVRHVAGPERWTPPPPSAAVVAEWASTGLA
ncbi:MAG: gyrase subunit, partial [Frankiaceae bacterium]|nr:gyrase subunit [Frankiaceae bacterium]